MATISFGSFAKIQASNSNNQKCCGGIAYAVRYLPSWQGNDSSEVTPTVHILKSDVQTSYIISFRPARLYQNSYQFCNPTLLHPPNLHMRLLWLTDVNKYCHKIIVELHRYTEAQKRISHAKPLFTMSDDSDIVVYRQSCPSGVKRVLATGGSAYIGEIDESTVVKYPLAPNRDMNRLEVERKLLEIIGPHPRIIGMKSFSNKGLNLERAVNETLAFYFNRVRQSPAIDPATIVLVPRGC